VQCIDQNPSICPSDVCDNPAGRREVGDEGPGHEFEIGPSIRTGRQPHKICKTIREPIEIRIVSRDQNVPGAERAPVSKNAEECGNLGSGCCLRYRRQLPIR